MKRPGPAVLLRIAISVTIMAVARWIAEFITPELREDWA